MAEMVSLLVHKDFILALKTEEKLVFGASATKKERAQLTDKIKAERREAAKLKKQ